MKAKYPDHTFENAASRAGASVQCLWQMRGPKNTAVAHIECLTINGTLVIVETFEGGGWEVFTPGHTIDIDETIADALARCGVKETEAA